MIDIECILSSSSKWYGYNIRAFQVLLGCHLFVTVHDSLSLAWSYICVSSPHMSSCNLSLMTSLSITLPCWDDSSYKGISLMIRKYQSRNNLFYLVFSCKMLTIMGQYERTERGAFLSAKHRVRRQGLNFTVLEVNTMQWKKGEVGFGIEGKSSW